MLEPSPEIDIPLPTGEEDYGQIVPDDGDRGYPRVRGAARLSRSRWFTMADCAESEPRDHIIKGLIAPRDLVLMFGGPGLGKSCLAPRLAYAIAQGLPIFGRRVKQGRVLYIAAEDSHGMRARFKALWSELGDTPDLLMGDGSTGFMEVDGSAERELRQLMAKFQPAVVIIDTIAAAFSGLKENDSGEKGMGRVVDFARGLIADFGVAVILLHHVPKGDTSTPRGHGMLHGDADVGLVLSPGTGKQIRVKFTKNRNGPSDGTLAFTIRAVTVEIDDDGDPVTAPICDPSNEVKKAGTSLAPLPQLALNVLKELLQAEESSGRDGADRSLSRDCGVSVDQWKAVCKERRLSKAASQETRDRAFRDVFKKLRDLGMVATKDGNVWPVQFADDATE